MEQLLASFNRVDASLDSGDDDSGANGSGGGSLAQRIGERLEELERQRQRAQDAKRLLMCWLEVSERGSLGTLETLKRRAGGDGKVRSAALARQLLKISQRLEADDGAEVNGAGVNGRHQRARAAQQTGYPARELIEKFLEGLETDLLKQFDLHYRRQNYEGMKECATALRDFNDGASVTALFVNQHNFFIDQSQLITEEIGDTEM
jgi:hypothetical protein